MQLLHKPGARLGSNVASILSSDVANRASTFALYVLVSRRMGVIGFGQMSIVLTLFATFQVFAAAGLRNLMAREVAKQPGSVGQFCGDGLLIVSAASSFCIMSAAVLVVALNYEWPLNAAVVLMCVGLLPYSWSVICEAILQGTERMHYIALANIPANCIKVLLAFAALRLRVSLLSVVLCILVAQTLAVVAEWVMLRSAVPMRLALDIKSAATMVRRARPFLAVDGLLAVMSSLVIIMVSRFASTSDAGLYNACTQLLAPVSMVCQNVTAALYPRLCRGAVVDNERVRRLIARMLQILLSLALPAAAGLWILSGGVLVAVYGRASFYRAGTALRIMAVMLLLTAVTNVLGSALMACGRERQSAAIAAVNLASAFLLGMVLIPAYGLAGAAVTVLGVRVCDTLQHLWRIRAVLRERPSAQVPTGRALWSTAARTLVILWRPATATFVMAVFLQLRLIPNTMVSVLTAAALYGAVLLVLSGSALPATGYEAEFQQ